MSPSKISGRFHSAKGAVRENIGRTIGWTGLQVRGASERAAGNAEYNTARAKGYAKGTGSRIAGKKDQIVGAVTGDRSQMNSGGLRSDKGSAVQSFSRHI